MKSFAVFAFFGFVAIVSAGPFTEDQVKKAQDLLKVCIDETKVDPSVVQKLREGDFSNNDEKAQCFTFCFFNKAGFIDANGDQNEKVIIEKLSTHTSEAQIKEFIEKCKNVQGSTPCEKAFLTYQCYHGLIKN